MMATVTGLALVMPGGGVRAEQASAAVSENALEAAMETVFTVRSTDGEDRFLGSAFLWGDAAVVAVTNAHVVGDAEEVRLIDRTGREEIGLVIARDAVRDVAVISVAAAPDGKPRRGLMPSDTSAGLGHEVFALGAPLGVEFTLTEGRISAKARQVDIAVPLLMLQHDAALNPGSSGGPLVDAAGRLIGMNSQIADGSRMFVGIAYAIPAADLDRIVTGLIEETLPEFPTLGLKARPMDRKVAGMLDLAPQGLLVDGTEKGGLAEAAGLKAGDVILAVNGTAIAAPGDFAFLVEAALGGDTAALTVLRGGGEIMLDLTFELPETDPAAIGVKTREIDLAQPQRVASYRLAALGVMLGDDGAVAAVTENSPALFVGLIQGDRIVAVNGVEMDQPALEALEISKPAMLRVQAPDGSTRHLFLDPWGTAAGVRPVGGANVLDPSVIVF
jgi:serine protease Do